MPLRPRLTRVALASTAALLIGAGGCSGSDEASAAGLNHEDLVSATAAQLARVTGLTYTATYQLTGGGTATVTQGQRPTRTAYVYPGGRLLQTGTSTIRCQGDAPELTCTETAPAAATATPLPGGALITPEAALAMLNAASLDRDRDAVARDSTIAGRHAACVDLSRVDGTPTDRFGLCVTNEGALASFTATIAGRRYEQALTAYAEKAAPADLTLPPGTKVTDKRR